MQKQKTPECLDGEILRGNVIFWGDSDDFFCKLPFIIF
jgi:hypothetical protein